MNDAIHAIVHKVHGPKVLPSRIPGRLDPHLWIGPPAQPDALVPLIEVLAEITPGQSVWIFHVLPAQQENLDLFA